MTNKINDPINPNYYTDMPIAPSHYNHANGIGYLEGNVIKYISRHKSKNGAEDIRKAIKYCELILELEYGDRMVDLPTRQKDKNRRVGLPTRQKGFPTHQKDKNHG